MSLKDIVVGGTTIEVGGVDVVLHGLTINTVAALLEDHREPLMAMLGGGDPDWGDLLTKFSGFVGALIASSAGEPDAADSVELWPAGVQLGALEVIWNETSLDADTLGKVLSGFIQGMEKVGGSLPQITG